MRKPSRPFEYIYIYLNGFNTVKDGAIMALFAMDGYSEFAFAPVTQKQPKTDRELKIIFEKLFDNIFREYKAGIHPDSITFITNLHGDLKPLIINIVPNKHKIIFDKIETENAIKPLLDSLSMFIEEMR